jgi:urea transport system ATP-binding protein
MPVLEPVTNTKSILTLEQVCAKYSSSQVLFDISMQIPEHGAVAILGRNGVGKTTLLRTMMGVHPLASGNIVFADEQVGRAPAYIRARKSMAFVPQGRGIFPHLTVHENLLTGLSALSGRNKESQLPSYIFDLFPIISDMKDRKGGNLSGGQQQQLAIARALVTQPQLLLLDEPTEGIQPNIVEQIHKALNVVRLELKVAVVLVEQYLDFAWEFADHFYVLQKGHVVDSGETHARAQQSVAHWLHV